MAYCIWCDQDINLNINWENLFLPIRQIGLCDSCQNALDILEGKRCIRCSRTSDETVCADCNKWDARGKDPLHFNYSLFAYNERIQDMITKWKYRGDYMVGIAFKYVFLLAFKQKFGSTMKDVLVVPIPLSKQRLMERGFNQAQVLANFLQIETKAVLTRIDGEKQSKKTRYERISAKNPFKMTHTINKPVILVDDIYTTGTTLRHAAHLLKQHGCPQVYAYTLARG